jgi:MSHA biogenesis protein MshQ
MLATCVDPNECAGSQVTINNLSADIPINTLNNAASKTYTEVDLDFSNDTVNSAEFIFTYPDAGKVQLHARYNIRDENGDPTGNYMLGSSSAFVVRPLGFYINVDGNPKAQSANQVNSAFKKAGDDFTTSLTAVQWQAADDSDGNGIPDTGADLSNNTATVNFGNETIPEVAIISDNLYLPNLGVEGNLTNNSFSDFTDGVAINGVDNNKSMTYDEVGIVSFTANLASGSYLGTVDITGVEPYVGRFIPDHFELTTSLDGDLMSVCDINTPFPAMTFAYSGQMSRSSTSSISSKGSLQYQFAPELFITAKSSNCPSGTCTTTSNYTGDFIKLLPSNVNYITPTEDSDTVDLLGAKVKLTANLSEGIFLDENEGVITYAFNTEDNFVYLRDQNTEIGPFPAKIELGIEAVSDTDGVVAIDSDGDADNGRLWVLNPEGKEIRFGRASLENSFGPETSPIGQVLSVEYYNGTDFVVADNDTCTQYNSTNVTFGSLNSVGIDSADIPAVSGAFVDIDDLPNGVTRQIVLPAVAAGNQGKVEVIYTVYPWLQYDWNWNGVEVKTLNENPSAIATFGLFRGNDRIIYIREVF